MNTYIFIDDEGNQSFLTVRTTSRDSAWALGMGILKDRNRWRMVEVVD